MHDSEIFQQTMSVIEHNRACTDPFALKGDGRFLTHADAHNVLTRFREHTFLRAMRVDRLHNRCFYVFAEDGYGERRYTVTTFMRMGDETIDRWQQTLQTPYIAFLYLGLNECPLDARWEVIPLPEGFMP